MWKPCGKLQLCIKNMIRAEISSIFVWYLVCWSGSNLLLLQTSLYGNTATRLNFNKSMYTLLLTCIKIKYHVPVLWYTGMTGSEFSAAVTVVSVYRTLDIYISDWFQTLYDNSFHWTFLYQSEDLGLCSRSQQCQRSTENAVILAQVLPWLLNM